ncbi:glutaredoxin 2 [Spea bombifrons]|uniref:glutaredoxin 2 n=1 Tax=Spea bombifrons TaxID=233779 RepID=UPI00234A90FE|nr:glutaredoxin 2 [Spea bombifrons]
MRLLPVLCNIVARHKKPLKFKDKAFAHLLYRFNSSFVSRMGNFFSSSSNVPQSEAVQMIKETISENCVVIFSKTTCPYCTMAKEAFNDINVNYKAVELDQVDNGAQLQTILHKMTGARTVPRVFVNGRCIGGGSETRKLNEEGKLLELVQQCGISAAQG